MRVVGFILIVLGTLALGYEAFGHVVGERELRVSIPPLLGGIVLVSGLLVIAATARRADDELG
jgi:hypothetical protein